MTKTWRKYYKDTKIKKKKDCCNLKKIKKTKKHNELFSHSFVYLNPSNMRKKIIDVTGKAKKIG